MQADKRWVRAINCYVSRVAIQTALQIGAEVTFELTFYTDQFTCTDSI